MIEESAHVRPVCNLGAGPAEHRCANERLIILLDLTKVLSAEEHGALQEMDPQEGGAEE